MRRVFSAFFLFFVLSCVQPCHVQGAVSLSQILDGILKRYGDLPAFTVPYQREIITKSMAMLGDEMKGDLASGKIYFKSPHYLSIKQEEPRLETITTNSHTLWWFIPEKEVVYQYRSNRLGKELQLLGDIFQGLKEVGDSFDVIQSDLGESSEYHLKLVPNPPWEEINSIDLVISKEGFYIRKIDIKNVLGNITRFNLGDLSEREDIDSNFFTFKVPKGVRVIEEE